MKATPFFTLTDMDSNSKSDLQQIVSILWQWNKTLRSYYKFDSRAINNQLNSISRFIRTNRTMSADLVRKLRNCRDKALKVYADRETTGILAYRRAVDALIELINITLQDFTDFFEDRYIKKVKKQHADNGMSERYSHLTRRLEQEKIRKLRNKSIVYTDFKADCRKDINIARRIIEKRAAQTVHRQSKRNRYAGQFRYSVRRAVSFSIYRKNYTDYDPDKRHRGSTHWKIETSITRDGSAIRLRRKKHYNTYEEASEACNYYRLNHPYDMRPLTPYICNECGRWHIGHTALTENPDPVMEVS